MMKRFEIRSEAEKVVVVFRHPTWGYFFMFIWTIQIVCSFLFQSDHISRRFVSLLMVDLIVLVFLLWLIDLGSKDVVEFTQDSLTQESRKLGISHTKTYHMREIQSPHFAPSIPGWSGTPSGLAFLYDGQEVRLCRTIKQEEAKQIVAAALQQFPKLKFVWGSYVEGVPEPEPEPPPNVFLE